MTRSLLPKTLSGLACGILVLIGLWVDPSNGQTPFEWDLRGTAVQNDHAYAILENRETGERVWVGVGDTINQATVIRIERDRVVLFGEDHHIVLTDQTGNDIDRRGGSGLDGLLSEEFARLLKIPTLISETHRVRLLEEISRVYEQGNLISAATRLHIIHIVPGEEWVTGVRTAADLPALGLQDKDLIIQINGITPTSYYYEKGWETIFDVVKRAKLITVSYVRGEQVYSNVFEVLN